MRERGMEKFTYRIRLRNDFQIGEAESFFSDMAAEGRHLDHVGFWRFRFREGPPERVRYRIDITRNASELSEEDQKRIYGEYGWEYVDKLGQFFIFRSPEDSEALEIHTDPAEQAFTLKYLEKKLIWSAATLVVATILMFVMLCVVWFASSTPVMDLVEGQLVLQSFMSLCYIYLLGSSLGQARGMRALCGALREGRPMDHHADWKKHRRNGKITFAFALLFLLLYLAVVGISINQLDEKYYELPVADESLPIVQLSDIEQNPQLIRPSGAKHIWSKYDSYYTKEWNILASAIYNTIESGQVPGRLWKDGRGVYTPSLSTEVYQLRAACLAKPLAEELIRREYDKPELYGVEGAKVSELQDSRFDYVAAIAAGRWKQVAAARGKNVVYLNYNGEADMGHILDEIDRKL